MKKKISTLKKYKLAGPVDPPESSAAEKFLNKTSSERKPIVSGVSFNPAKPSRTSSNNNTDFLKKIAGSGSSSSGSSNSKPYPTTSTTPSPRGPIYKKGGSTKMKMGGSVKKSSSKKK